MHHHAERIPDQDHVAIFVDQPRGVRVIGGETHDRLTVLARANVGRRQPPDLVLHRHRVASYSLNALKRKGDIYGRASSYSITSSARASNVGGTIRPSALAVLRLIVISNLVGCWTGRLPGASPLKI